MNFKLYYKLYYKLNYYAMFISYTNMINVMKRIKRVAKNEYLRIPKLTKNK